MANEFFHIFIQILLVIVMLSAMALLLLGMHRMIHNESGSDKKETEALRHEVEETDSVLSSNNLFHGFLARGRKREGNKI